MAAKKVSEKTDSLAGKLAVRAETGKGGTSVFDLIERQKSQIDRALPNIGLTAERLVRVLHTQIRLNPKLASCSPQSLLGCVMLTAQLGLEPGPLGQAYLVPFFNKQVNTFEAQFIIGYKGLIQLAWRSGILINAYTVRANDLFEFDYGTGHVRHTYKITQQRGDIIGFWAKAVIPNETTAVQVMTLDEVEAHRNRSAAKDSGPWVTDFEAMGKKTVIRVLASQLPLNSEAQKAMAADETPVLFEQGDLVTESGAIDVIDAEPVDTEVRAETETEKQEPLGFEDIGE